MNPIKFSIGFLIYVVFYFCASESPLSDYKDIAQAPKTGVHKYRIGPFALVDMLATFILALLIAIRFEQDPFSVFTILLFVSVPIHMLFGVNTALIKMINHER